MSTRALRWAQLPAHCTCGEQTSVEVPAWTIRHWLTRNAESVVLRHSCGKCGQVVHVRAADIQLAAGLLPVAATPQPALPSRNGGTGYYSEAGANGR